MAAIGYTLSPETPNNGSIALGSPLVLDVALVAAPSTSPTLGADLNLFIVVTHLYPRYPSPVGVLSCDLGNAIVNNSLHKVTIPAGGPYALPFHIFWTPSPPLTTALFTISHNGGGSGFASGGDPGPFTFTIVSTPVLLATSVVNNPQSIQPSNYPIVAVNPGTQLTSIVVKGQ